LQKQLVFNPFTILDEKCALSFYFPSKHVIVTNYNFICDFIQLCQHYNHIYDYTHLRLKWHVGLTQL
jgi:hypothetical protein